MNSKLLRLGFIAVLLAFNTPVDAQQQAKTAKIGFLSGSESTARSPEAWLVNLRKLGYVEGKNFTVERRYAESKLDRLPVLADELVRLKVDVILTFSTPAARAAKNATKTIPIVFLTEGDPVGSELVDSLARPGGNVTGVTTISSVIAGKRLELLPVVVNYLGNKASWRRYSWDCSSIPWRWVAPTNLSVHLKGRLRRVVQPSLWCRVR